MNIALLFNSDAEKFDGCYGDPIRKIVFDLGILQSSKRHMKVAVGDVLIYGKSRTWRITTNLPVEFISQAHGPFSMTNAFEQRFAKLLFMHSLKEHTLYSK